MSLGSLVVSLSANIAQFTSAMDRAQYIAHQNARQISGSVNSMKASFDAVPASIMKIAAAAGGLYAVGSALKSAIVATDEFKMATISIAAGLTNIAKPGQGDWGDIFKRNMDYAKQMARELERVAAVSPAEPAEMMMAYNQLVQQGYAARLDEADALGVIVTRIKLATAGQASNKQINQEIRAVLQGQAKDESMVAMELKNRIGPGWADIVRKQAESGNLLKWWASLYPGITAASEAFQMTLEAQGTTLIGNLKWLSREGMGGAYDYIVAKAQELNTWIQNNGTALAANMGVAWQNLKPSVEAVVAAIVSFAKFMGSAAMTMTEVIAKTTEWLKENKSLVISILELYAISKVTAMITTMSGAMALAITNITKTVGSLGVLRAIVAGPWSPITIVVTIVGLAAALTGLRKLIQAKLEAAGVLNPNEAERPVTSGPRDQVLSAAGTKISPQQRRNIQAEYEARQRKIEETISHLKPPEVQMPGGTGGKGGGGKGGADSIQKEIEKINKEVDKARKDAMDAENDAFNMVWKLKQDTAQMYADATKGQYEIKGLYKDSYDTLGSISPIMGDQIAYQKKALDLQMDIEKYTLETKIDKLGINKAQADELRGLQALTAQAKKFNQEMESDKGIRGWAYGRAKSDSQKNTVADMMEGAETFITDVFSQGIQGALSKTKVDFMEVGKTMAQSLALNLAKQGIHKAFGALAQALTGGIGKLGTDANPMVVTIKGMGSAGLKKGMDAGAAFDRTVKKAGKVGHTMGGGNKGQNDFSFTDQYFKDLQKGESKFDRVFTRDLNDWNNKFKVLTKTGDVYSDMQGQWARDNQEAFNTEYIGQYQSDFTGMATGMTNVWGVAQGLMTTAGVSGEAARYGAMVTYGMQGISLISSLAKSKILIDAAQSAASAYKWVMSVVPWPINVPLAIAAGAAAFAATAAFGNFQSSEGGDYRVATTGPRIIHQEETVLPAWAAQGWRDIVSRESAGAGRPGENGQVVNHISVTHSPTYRYRATEADYKRDARMIVKAINQEVGRRGRKL